MGQEEKQDIEYYKIVRDIAEKRYQYTWDNKRDLDEKSQNLIIFSGVISSIYIGIATVFSGEHLMLKAVYVSVYNMLILLYSIGVLSIMCSIYYALQAYKLRRWAIATKPEEIFSIIYDKENLDDVLNSLSEQTCEAIKSNDGYLTWLGSPLRKGII